MENILLERITLDANICHGKPCIRGLRYPVEFILELLSHIVGCVRFRYFPFYIGFTV
ncbi:DUF433 domain-containing protein [Aerosakkonemataceae cyanobacterium BLCC-F154]|uniref:DUF433 domain-containing protein n=1 Tax=Floridaenema fluviatile BLCC-F154 TaxID=3153640 RepID=A0ABV4YHG0_9CYAN